MATKTTKKSTVKKTVKKADVKSAPVMEHKCACGEDCPCKCHNHGTAHWVKHVVIYSLVFACGMVAGTFLGCMPPQPKYNDQGCVIMESVQCPMMKRELRKADTNGDQCISKDEYRAAEASLKARRDKKPVKRIQPVFQDDCLVMDSVTNQKLKEALKTADANADSCISKEEFEAAKKAIRPEPKNARDPKNMQGPKGMKGPKGPKAK